MPYHARLTFRHRTYVFSGYDQAVQPVTVTVSSQLLAREAFPNLFALQGYIPGGSTFQFNPPTGPSNYDWLADLKAGTSVVFAMTDSRGRNGRYHPTTEGIYD